MRPRFPVRVTLRTPALPQPDPETGNDTAGPPVEVQSPAYLAQRPVANLSSAIEDNAGQDSVTSLYTLLVPPGAPLTSKTTVIDSDGYQYEVEGDPAPRRQGFSRRVLYQAAAVRRTSDLQEA